MKAWIPVVALMVVASCASVVFSKRGGSGSVATLAPPVSLPSFAPWPSSSSSSSSDAPRTIIPLPPGFNVDQRLTPNDVRGGNAGLLTYDPNWLGGWLGLRLP